MKKQLFVLGSLLFVSTAFSQTVPPDYPAQQNPSLESQIESVRLNYEDVKTKAEQKLAKEKAEAAKAKAQQEARKAAAAKKLAAQKKAAAQKRAARQEKLERYADESTELDLELKRLQVRQATARTKLDEAATEEQIKRINEVVDIKLQKGTQNK